MSNILWSLIFLGCIVTSCSNTELLYKKNLSDYPSEKNEEKWQRDINYFLKHDKELKKDLKICEMDGMLVHTSRCKNAFEAKNIKIFRDMQINCSRYTS